MLFAELINQKFYLTYMKLTNYKGLKRITGEDNVYELDLNDTYGKNQIILIYGENGYGKSTILENMHPYSEMISEDRPISTCIEYPASKVVNFKNDKLEIKCEIEYISSTSTKGYIYFKYAGLDDFILYENTEKGNITEYRKVINELFLDFNKFKNSLFMQQDIKEIVKAKPSQRANIINNFSKSTVSYEDIKKHAVIKVKNLKDQIAILEEDIENYKGYENRQTQLEEYEKSHTSEQLETIQEEYNISKLKLDKIKEDKGSFEHLNKELLNIENKLLALNISEIKEKIEKYKIDLDNLKSNEDGIDINETQNELDLINNKINTINNNLNNISALSFDSYEKIRVESKENLEKMVSKNELFLQNFKNATLLIENKNELIEEIKKDKEKFDNHILALSKDDINLSISENENKISLINNKIFEFNTQTNELKDKKNKLSKIEKIEIKTIEVKLDNIKKRIQENLSSQEELNKINKALNSTVEEEKEHKCKHCNSVLDYDSLINHKEELENKIENINELNLEKELLEKKYEKSKKDSYDYDLLTSEIDILEKKIYKLNKEDSENKISELKEKNENLRNQLLEVEKNELIKASIEKKEIKLKSINSSIDDIKKLNLDIDELINIDFEETNLLLKKYKQQIKFIDILVINNLEESSLEEFNKFNESEKNKLTINKEKVQENINQYKNIMEKKNNINILITQEENKEKTHFEFNEKKKELNDSINKMEYNEQIFIDLVNLEKEKKDIFEKEKEAYSNYLKDKEYIEEMMSGYTKKKEQIGTLKQEELIYTKIKNYSDRIKKAQVSNFFGSISNNINEIISTEEGSLKDLHITIKQKGNKNLDIIADTGFNKADDIRHLSGAEKNVVAKGISLALALENNFGIAYVDESDGMLSKGNKSQFYNSVLRTQELLKTNQIFLISHDENMLLKADKVINIK